MAKKGKYTAMCRYVYKSGKFIAFRELTEVKFPSRMKGNDVKEDDSLFGVIYSGNTNALSSKSI